MKTLLEAVVEPNGTDWNKSFPMHTAAVYGSLDAMDLLLRLGPSATVLGEFGHTPCDCAVDSGQTGAQKLLLPHRPR